MTHFISKETIIEAEWLNKVDATVLEALQSATTASGVRQVLNVPEDTSLTAPQLRINGAWTPLSSATLPAHAGTHSSGGADQIDHDNLVNSAGDKHIDHSTVTITGTGALSGGGAITGSQQISFTYTLGQDLDANNFAITGLKDPVNDGDAVNLAVLNQKVIVAQGNPWDEGQPLGQAHIVYTGSGNVGIGTDTPVYKLDVRGEVRMDQDVTVQGALSTAGLTSSEQVNVNNILAVTNWINSSNARGIRGSADSNYISLAGGLDNAQAGNVTVYGKAASGLPGGVVVTGVTTRIKAGATVGAAVDAMVVNSNRSVDFTSAVDIAGALDVTGATTLPTITGPTTLNGDLTIQ